MKSTSKFLAEDILNAIKIGKYKKDKELFDLLMYDIECLREECIREYNTYSKEKAV